ncbi:DUF1932 domain-containing protein [Mixta sp. Marseille-Q2659]|uniref:DUF1932 domain-containing protein n=1 Tax=Mixta sp. Marseille-Q2659 TaxID=2736607 RepID=UPI0023B97C0E|nr:DUF1932 domain-containing protein [Mixta sp. Marseille-Q2659]
MTTVAIIGFGEAGTIFASDLADKVQVNVWDLKFVGPERDAMLAKAEQAGVTPAASLAAAIADAQLIFSLVTADSALTLAQEAAPLLTQRQTFLDFNSVAPETKRSAERAVTQRQGNYLDVAVMAPVPPARLRTPLLLGGKEAERVAAQLRLWGCHAQALSDRVGDVSAIKMCRSVMIKGLEALTTECLTAARRYGVEEAVLDSLHASFPSLGWHGELADYLISRVAQHGRRRSEEMREVVKMLQDVALSGTMSQAIAESQLALVEQMAQKQIDYQMLLPFSWQQTVDKLA